MPCIAKTHSQTDGRGFLQQAFARQQDVLRAQLKLAEFSITHDGKRGDVAEQHFITVLRQFLPSRYQVDSAIILDHTGETSDQIDIVIYDRQYTPTLLDQRHHKYIPAEAVYAVFEVKPTLNKVYLEYAGNKIASVRRLRRTSAAITDIRGVNAPNAHKPILGGIITADIEWADGFGESFRSNHAELSLECGLQCGLAVDGGCFDVFGSNGAFTFGPTENGLIFFLFRLLNQLRLMGTVPAIDGNAYAEQFTRS